MNKAIYLGRIRPQLILPWVAYDRQSMTKSTKHQTYNAKRPVYPWRPPAELLPELQRLAEELQLNKQDLVTELVKQGLKNLFDESERGRSAD